MASVVLCQLFRCGEKTKKRIKKNTLRKRLGVGDTKERRKKRGKRKRKKEMDGRNIPNK